MRYILITLFVFILNCKGNKVSNYHGNKLLDKKYNIIQVNKTNKNDLLQLIGPPSSISDFNENKWFYIERLKTNQSIIKLGNQVLKKNNVLIVEFNKMGIIKNKEILNLENMNDLKYLKKTTEKDFKQDNVIYNIFTSLREKINAPARTRKK